MATCGALILGSANAVVLGLGIWWGNTSLTVAGAVATGAAAFAFVVPEGISTVVGWLKTLAWLAIAGVGAYIVYEYRVRGDDGAHLWALQFSWWILIPGVGSIVQWVVDLVRRVPEGVGWTDIVGGAGLAIWSVVYRLLKNRGGGGGGYGWVGTRYEGAADDPFPTLTLQG